MFIFQLVAADYPDYSTHYASYLRLNIISPQKVEIIPLLGSLPPSGTTCKILHVVQVGARGRLPSDGVI